MFWANGQADFYVSSQDVQIFAHLWVFRKDFCIRVPIFSKETLDLYATCSLLIYLVNTSIDHVARSAGFRLVAPYFHRFAADDL